MDFTAFSHGQVQSKYWLCQQLEPYIPTKARVAILGSWYNVLGFMMTVRKPDLYQSITGIDIDPEVNPIADKINDSCIIENSIIKNVIADVNDFDFKRFNVLINCSPEHMESNQWFDNIPPNTLVCIQSSNMTVKDDDVWKCVNSNSSLEELKNKYPLSRYFFSGTKRIQYDDWGYDRFMIIGVKQQSY